jgi:hypothetical protein
MVAKKSQDAHASIIRKQIRRALHRGLKRFILNLSRQLQRVLK